MAPTRSLLLHAIVRRGHPAPSRPARLIAQGAIAAAVSPAPGVPQAGSREVRRHMDVVGGLFEKGTVIPFRFGTVVADEQELRRHLSQAEARYAALIEDLDGTVELLLKVEPQETAVVTGLLNARPALRELAASAAGQGFEGQVHLGRAVAEGYEEVVLSDAERVMAVLAPLARRTCELNPAGGAYRASLLVDGIAAGRLEAAASRLERESGGRLRLTLKGPLPPYSFVEGLWDS